MKKVIQYLICLFCLLPAIFGFVYAWIAGGFLVGISYAKDLADYVKI